MVEKACSPPACSCRTPPSLPPHLALARQADAEPGVALDEGQRDALGGVCHKNAADEVLAALGEPHF
jgi:hypothetical protein